MQLVMTAIAVTVGMAFSLGIAILTEELIFGRILGPLFAHQTVPAKSDQVFRHD